MGVTSSQSLKPTIAPTQSLIQSVIRKIDQSRQASSHLPETSRYLDYVRAQLVWFGRLLHRAHSECDNDEESPRDEFAIDYKSLKKARDHVSQALFEFIPLFRSLCDGTTDALPYALAGWLESEYEAIRSLSSVSGASGVALCPVLDVNFFYRNLREVTRQFDSLSDQVGKLLPAWVTDREPRPPSPVPHPFYIGFQYTMDQDVFFNAILFHELGHHVAAEAAIRANFLKLLVPRLCDELQNRVRWYRQLGLSEDYHDRLEQRKRVRQLIELTLNWVEELFCDSFGVLIAGPQMTFALYDLSGPRLSQKAFSSTHPASLMRLTTQWRLLEELGWVGSAAQGLASTEFTQLAQKTFGSLTPDPLPEAKGWCWLNDTNPVTAEEQIVIKILEGLIPQVHNEARRFVPTGQKRAESFWQHADAVAMALNQMIVPSSLIVQGKQAPIHPHPTTLVNVARVLLHGGCRDLIHNWPGVPESDITFEQLQHIERRLSEWIQKAITDWELHIRSSPREGSGP